MARSPAEEQQKRTLGDMPQRAGGELMDLASLLAF